MVSASGPAPSAGAPGLGVDLGRGLRLRTPVMAASGTFGYGLEYDGLVDTGGLGAIVTKGLSLRPREGNPPPRIVETPCGLINSIGLQNIGVEAFLREKLPLLAGRGVPIVANIFGTDVREYRAVARALDGTPIAGIEVNISCPNVKKGGMEFGTDPRLSAQVVRSVRRAFGGHLMVKLSPSAADIVSVARACEGEGADSLSLINTIPAMAIDVEMRRPRLSTVTGGLSGPAIRPIALRMVYEVARRVKKPVVGIGGIACAEDALQFIIAGASAVQVGTATFFHPGAMIDISAGIASYLTRHRVRTLSSLRRTLRP